MQQSFEEQFVNALTTFTLVPHTFSSDSYFLLQDIDLPFFDL